MYQLSREMSSLNRCHTALDHFMTSMQLFTTPVRMADYIRNRTTKTDNIFMSASKIGTETSYNLIPPSTSHRQQGPLNVFRFREAVAAITCRRGNNIYLSGLLNCSQMCRGDVEALSKASLAQRVCFLLHMFFFYCKFL